MTTAATHPSAPTAETAVPSNRASLLSARSRRVVEATAGVVAGHADEITRRFGAAEDRSAFAAAYAAAAVPMMRLQSLLTANVRVWAICIACLAGDPRIFWWFEIVPLTLVAIVGLVWHRRVERAFVRNTTPPRSKTASRMHLS